MMVWAKGGSSGRKGKWTDQKTFFSTLVPRFSRGVIFLLFPKDNNADMQEVRTFYLYCL